MLKILIKKYLDKHSLRGRLIGGAAAGFAMQIAFAVLSFVNAVMISRLIGIDGYGVFSNAMAWISVMVVPATFGFGTLLIRQVAVYRNNNEYSKVFGLKRFSDIFVIFFSILISILFYISITGFLPKDSNGSINFTLIYALPLIPLYALSNVREAAIRGYEVVVRSKLASMIVRPAILLLGMFVLFIFAPDTLSAETVMIINLMSSVIAFMLSAYWLSSVMKSEHVSTTIEYDSKQWVQAAWPLMIYGGMQILFGQTDIIMLGLLMSPEDVGMYAASSRLAIMLGFVMISVESILAPVIARLYVNGELERLNNVIKKASRMTFIVTIVPCIVIIIFRNEFLNIFGEEFVGANVALIILVISRLIHVAFGPGALLLSMTGNEKIVAAVLSVAVLLNVVLNYVLIPVYGIEGGAIATAISLVAMRLVFAFVAKIKLGINVTVFS